MKTQKTLSRTLYTLLVSVALAMLMACGEKSNPMESSNPTPTPSASYSFKFDGGKIWLVRPGLPDSLLAEAGMILNADSTKHLGVWKNRQNEKWAELPTSTRTRTIHDTTVVHDSIKVFVDRPIEYDFRANGTVWALPKDLQPKQIGATSISLLSDSSAYEAKWTANNTKFWRGAAFVKTIVRNVIPPIGEVANLYADATMGLSLSSTNFVAGGWVSYRWEDTNFIYVSWWFHPLSLQRTLVVHWTDDNGGQHVGRVGDGPELHIRPTTTSRITDFFKSGDGFTVMTPKSR